MQRYAMVGALAALLGMMANGAQADAKKPADKATRASYVHVVIFTMKKDAPKGAVEDVIKDCHKMLAKIASVRSVRVGRPAEKASPEFAKKDYDIGLLILVDDYEGLMSYLKDPLHVEFVKKHGKHFDMKQLKVFDFANQKK
jgi:hypothetical protein